MPGFNTITSNNPMSQQRKNIIFAFVLVALAVLFFGFCYVFMVELDNSSGKEEPKVPDSCMQIVHCIEMS